ncbi:MAG TPA: glycoside hydrolase family 3 C-terminal domain-containing protein, partial [Micromonosporaceae bacterium]|nr:glycoside hydrolase family 3 C-terminal domain-containing protein [Micromonosporaceae bacterium]
WRLERIGRLLAAEARRKGVDVLLAPTVNLHRSPYGGRHFECFSEDPLLSGRLGAACVRGLQSQGVGATVKHFVANDSETERFSLDVQVDERVLRELYLAPFEIIVRDGGVWAVMAAYNSVNGHTMTESPLLDGILRGEWRFDGLVMTDWYAGRSLASAVAGTDLVMPGPDGPWGDALVDAVSAGMLDEAVIDQKLTRLLRLAARVGALESVEGTVTPEPWPSDRVAAELRASAAAGFVLARNEAARDSTESLLPLDPTTIRRIAVIGANAAVARTMGGGSATVFPPYTISPLDGIRTAFGLDVDVRFARGGRITARVPTASTARLRRPDGGPGARLMFRSADGRLLRTEDRTGSAYAWLNSYGDGLAFTDVAVIELETRFTAAHAGTYLVGCSGLGWFELTVAGTVVAEEHLDLVEDADPVEAIMRPPQLVRPITLTAGDQVDLVLRYRPAGVGEFGDAAVAKVAFQLNADLDSDDDAELVAAVAAAASADVAIVVVGTTEEVESEGFDRTSLALPGRQDELVTSVARANPRTVVAVNTGAPVLLPWADDVPAVLLCWFPGQEFGHALADVLTGAAEPQGRLPVTWPASHDNLPSTTPVDGVLRYREGLLVGYRSDGQHRYCFGHGLGYTTWQYLTAEVMPGPDTTVTVRLRNTGRRAGREVVQVYASKPGSGIERPTRWLAGWTAVQAQPGQEATASVTVATRAFEHWDSATHRWAIEPGPFHLHIGPSSRTLPLQVELTPPDPGGSPCEPAMH